MSTRTVPTKLSHKLKQIRQHLGLTMEGMADAIGRNDPGRRSRIHEWETGKRQPDLASLLAYAQLVGVSTDILIDDDAELDLGSTPKGS